jgi:dihydroorotase
MFGQASPTPAQNLAVSYETVLVGGSLLLPGGIHKGDLAISNGKIAEIGDLSNARAETQIDVSGLLVMPGGIDTQVHFREPGLTHKEDIESGTRSALMGGITTVFEMPNTAPATISESALLEKQNLARGRSWTHIAFFVGGTPENADQLAELEMLPGTPGIKIFLGSSTGSLLMSNENDLRRALSAGVRRIPVHAEDEARNSERKAQLSSNPHVREHPTLRDAESAKIATERILQLSRETGRPIHVLHISTRDELPLLHQAKLHGLATTCEVTPQHLWFSAPDCYEHLGSLAQMNPPIRDRSHQEAIWGALLDGLFDVFGSDHAPHTLEEKQRSYPQSPSGMPGVQTMLSVLLTFVKQGKLPLVPTLDRLTARPADLYGIRKKGRLMVGFDADVVAVDLDATWKVVGSELETKCGWSPYEGETLYGVVRHVWVGGHHSVREGERQGEPAGTTPGFDWKPS